MGNDLQVPPPKRSQNAPLQIQQSQTFQNIVLADPDDNGKLSSKMK